MTVNASTQFYLGLNAAASVAIEQSTADPSQLGRAHQQVDELNRWLEALVPRPESVGLQHAIGEATVGMFLLASGLYRPAFVSLRLFLELSLASVHFSVNRLDLAEWLQGNRDVNWASLINSEEGVLSLRYTSAFFPELKDSVRTYNTIGSKAYRELSAFVHGNHHTWANSERNITFSAEQQSQWLSHFSAASTVVAYTLCLRFLKELPPPALSGLAPMVNETLGHVEAIRNYLRSTVI